MQIRTSTLYITALSACLISRCTSAQDQSQDGVHLPRSPRMEVTFVLDATGSMGGLIGGAKRKIWSIINQIATAKPQPEIKIGFVAYRDKGDAYVTQVHPLSSDLDGAFTTLSKFEAGGGGDLPEHVNAGLHDAVTKLNWSKGGSNAQELYQVIFLVGDCPPHMDYKDGLDYKTDVARAASRGIFVNAIRCGENSETEKVWLDIAKRGMGTYFSLPQDGGTINIRTPFDAPMIKFGEELELTTIAKRGADKSKQRSADASKKYASKAADRENALNRAAFAAKSSQIYASFDLTTQIANGRKPESIGWDELPDDLRKMSPQERIDYLKQKAADRKILQARLADFEKTRALYIKQRQEQADNKNPGQLGFDQKMLKTVQTQAARRGFRY